MVVSIEIGRVRVEFQASATVAGLLERYGRFAVATGPANWTFEVRPGHVLLSEHFSGRVVRRGKELRVEGLGPFGRLDTEQRRADVVADPLLLTLDSLVRAALQLSVHANGGFLAHAAALVVDGQAHLFPGRSGSGKTTLSSLASHVIADEICAILPAGAGFEVYGTPWWKGRSEPAPLAAVYSLAWNGEGVAPLPRRGALRHLARNLVLPLDGPADQVAAFAAAGRVAAAVPFGRLFFRPDSDVDALLRRARGASVA